MKKGGFLMLSVCALSLCLVLGIFIGRNLRGEFWELTVRNDNLELAQSTEPTDYRLNINTATKVQLMELPGIGEVIAERIISHREQNGPFQSIDSLMDVYGLGAQKLEEIESLIKVE